MRATILDVAREAGVSAASVSNAINGRRYVEAGTRQRILAAAKRLGYTPNVHARSLRHSGVGTIGLFSSMPFAVSGRESRLGFLMEIAATAAVSALQNGFALLLVPPDGPDLPRFDGLAIDAALVIEPSAGDPYVAQLRDRGIPHVTIGRQPGVRVGAASVDLRSAETARLLCEHLWPSSKRVALMIGSAQRTSYIETEAVYSEFASALGLEPAIARVDENGGEEAAYAATRELMAAHPDIDGILALVDTFATGALRALADSGLAVPASVRVATRYDGFRARESTPPLTAVDLHLDEVAAAAVALLLERIRSGRSSRQDVLAPPPALVVRRSSGVPLITAVR